MSDSNAVDYEQDLLDEDFSFGVNPAQSQATNITEMPEDSQESGPPSSPNLPGNGPRSPSPVADPPAPTEPTLPAASNTRSLQRQTSTTVDSRIADAVANNPLPAAPKTRGRKKGATSKAAEAAKGKAKAKSPEPDNALLLRVQELEAKHATTTQSHQQSLDLVKDYQSIIEAGRRDAEKLSTDARNAQADARTAQADAREALNSATRAQADVHSYQAELVPRLHKHARYINQCLTNGADLQRTLDDISSEHDALQRRQTASQEDTERTLAEMRRRIDALTQDLAIEPIRTMTTNAGNMGAKRSRLQRDGYDEVPPVRPAPLQRSARPPAPPVSQSLVRTQAHPPVRLPVPTSTSSDSLNDVKYGPLPPDAFVDIRRLVSDVMGAAGMPYGVHVLAEYAHDPAPSFVRIRFASRSAIQHFFSAISAGKIAKGLEGASAELIDLANDPGVGPSLVR